MFSSALIDSACSSNLIDEDLCKELGVTIYPLLNKSPVSITSSIGESAEQIIGELVGTTGELLMRIGDHSEIISFGITRLVPDHPIILGKGWLTSHNPEIDWEEDTITFSRCSCVDYPVIVTGIEVGNDGERVNSILLNAAFASGADNPIPTSVPIEYAEYERIFDEAASTVLPQHRPLFDCSLDLKDPDAIPPNLKLIPLNPEKDAILKAWLDDQLSKGWIRSSKSPCAAPVFFVRKHPKGWRNCTDYRRLNEMLVKNRCPLPLISEMIDRLTGATIFTKLDLRNAYNQLRIKEGDEWKTAFITKYGLYETLVMNFGLCNAPSIFQHWMNSIFHDLLDVYVLVYLDDIIIYSKDAAEHTRQVREVLRRLMEHNCFLRLEKCVFNATECEFVGFKIGPHGLEMTHKKAKAIEEWPIPSSKTAVQSFLGFINFYRRFIKDFSAIALPLTNLTRKDQPFRWNEDANNAFISLKHRALNAPVLRHINPDLPFIVETDASDYATGAVLIQKDQSTGFPHPVAFTSKKLNPAESRYATYDKELYAIVRALETWRHHLLSSPFPVTIFTDHNNLRYFRTRQILSQKQITWSMFLSEFNFRLEHKAGTRNQVADALSRREDHKPTDAERICSREGLVLPSEHFVAHPTIVANMAHLESGASYSEGPESPSEDEDDEVNTVERKASDALTEIHDDKEKLLITKLRHDSPTAGHYGTAKTLRHIQRDFTWKNIRSFVKEYVRSCDCSRNKAPRHKPYGKLSPFPFATTPWTQVSLDFIVKLPISQGFDSILVVCDRGMTKMVHFIPCSERINAEQTADLFMRNVFKLHGLPSQIISDRGPQFESAVWNAFMKSLRVKPSMSTAYHPQTDGQSERSNQTLEQYLRNYVNYTQDDWMNYLHYAEFAFNNAVHEGVGLSPFMSLTGYNPRADFLTLPTIEGTDEDNALRLSRLKEIQLKLSELLREAQIRYKNYADKRRIDSPFKVGDRVWLLSKHLKTTRPSKKLDHIRVGPFVILEQIGSEAWKLELPPTMARIHPVFHSSLLEVYYPNTIPERVTPAPPPVLIDEQLEWEVASILDSRRMGRGIQYLVRWKGHPGEDSWEPSRNITHCSNLLQDFHRTHPEAHGIRSRG
jgi:transposase InsO family protein